MAEKSFRKKILPHIWKAALKAAVILVLFFLFSTLIEPLEDVFPGFKLLLGAFVAMYVFFVVASELSSGTIFHYMFNVGKALFLILYFIYALEGGVIAGSVEIVHFTVDLTLLLGVLILLQLLGLAKSLLQAVHFLAEQAERS
ncbi:MAG: hypothetical protein U9O89_08075 [Thermoproteota archaeon]|nr:hypothetical protein [Thermoproteota archaeon]